VQSGSRNLTMHRQRYKLTSDQRVVANMEKVVEFGNFLRSCKAPRTAAEWLQRGQDVHALIASQFGNERARRL